MLLLTFLQYVLLRVMQDSFVRGGLFPQGNYTVSHQITDHFANLIL
jgi:hypothetical protein